MRAIDLDALRAFEPQPPTRLRPSDSGEPLTGLAAPGRIVELCGEARTSAAVLILAHLQRQAETAAWIQPRRGDLYPPDLAEAGVDIEALTTIHVPLRALVSTPLEQCRSAELLLRSGAFGLVVLDFTHEEPRGTDAWQGRLLGLARRHEARVLVLRDEQRAEAPSLGPLIGLRIRARFEPAPADLTDDPPGFEPQTRHFWLTYEVLKNKSGGPIDPQPTLLRGPWGLN